jgi:hypothetical protein
MSDAKVPGPVRMLPGVAAIGLWMFLLCLLGLIGVTRHALPPAVLIFCAAFALAGQGLLRLRRWGWALTLAAVLLSATYGMWGVVKTHQLSMIVMVAINLILFLYLVRPEVRERLK